MVFSSSSPIGSSKISSCLPNGSCSSEPWRRGKVSYLMVLGYLVKHFLSFLYSYKAWKKVVFFSFRVFSQLLVEWKESRNWNYFLNGTTYRMERKQKLQLSVEWKTKGKKELYLFTECQIQRKAEITST